MSIVTKRDTSRLVFWATALGAMMTSLDLSIGNVALPAISRDFPNATATQLSWVLNAYTVVLGGLLLASGRIADLIGRRRVYLFGVATFTVASAGIAAAPSIGWLIAARGLQGVGAAAITPASLGLLIGALGEDRRSEAVGRWSGLHSFAVVLGPSLGGLLVQFGTWRSAFAINLPIGVLVIVITRRHVPDLRPSGQRRPDIVGALLVSAMAVTGALALVEGPRRGWTSGLVTTTVTIGLVALAALVVRLRHHPDPIIDLGLLRDRRIRIATTGTFLYSAGFFAMFLGSILYLSHVWDYSDTAAGLSFTAGPALVGITSRRFGRLIARIGPEPLIVLGGCCLAASAAWHWWRLGPDAAFWTAWMPGHLLTGLGVAAIFTSLGAAAVRGVPEQRLAGATGWNQTSRQLGGVAGVAIAIGLLDDPLPTTPGGYSKLWLLVMICTLAAAACGALSGRERASPRRTRANS